ncbi:Uncharacterised protein [Mycobacteroides abscessus subsp. abscessus]|nr:Uncharacterised protein [Mycobacteroides abscessus subsp. abscessus]
METMVFGPLIIPFKWLYFLLAGITTYITVKIILKENKAFFKMFFDELINALFLWFLIFKFSTVLFRPSILFERPIEILYFTGGSKGLLLGTFIAVIFFIRKVHKNKWSISLTLRAAVYTLLTFVISYWIIHTFFVIFLHQ